MRVRLQATMDVDAFVTGGLPEAQIGMVLGAAVLGDACQSGQSGKEV